MYTPGLRARVEKSPNGNMSEGKADNLQSSIHAVLVIEILDNHVIAQFKSTRTETNTMVKALESLHGKRSLMCYREDR